MQILHTDLLMQHPRIYRAWLSSVIFPKYGNVVEKEKAIVNLPAFLDTGLPRGSVHERDSGPMRGAIPTQSHNP